VILGPLTLGKDDHRSRKTVVKSEGQIPLRYPGLQTWFTTRLSTISCRSATSLRPFWVESRPQTDRFELSRYVEISRTCLWPRSLVTVGFRPDRPVDCRNDRTRSSYDFEQLPERLNVHPQKLYQSRCQLRQRSTADSVHSRVSKIFLNACGVSASSLAPFANCCRPSVCRLSSVTIVHPTQSVVTFGNFSTTFGTLTICWHPRKIYGDRPREPLRRGS